MAVHYQIEGTTSAAISASVEAGIRRGALAPGAALPPVRTLAGEVGVSPATVAAAYRLLRERGLVETAGRNGTRVRGRPPVAARRQTLRPEVGHLVDLSSGEPDPDLLPRIPAGTPQRRNYLREGVLPELREAARERLRPVDGRHLTVASGALDGIERVLAAHLRPGDRIAVEDPGWANLLDLVAVLGLHPVPVPVDDDGPTVDGLARALSAGAAGLVVTSRAQNPTGATVTAGRARGLRGVLKTFPRVLVVEDDHAAELADEPLHPLVGATESWAFVRSCSKPFGPDLRLAVLAGDETTVARVEGRMRLGAGWVSTILQTLVVRMWSDPAVSAAVSKASRSYGHRRRALVEELTARGIPARGRSGVNVWVPVADETVAVTRLRDAGFAVAPGGMYRIATPPAVRISVGALRPPMVGPLVDALAASNRVSAGV
ncbi:GntR family transcriptional regulator [Virgisporangium aliadipatigenens]|uniref:GntR family transcriptional regulator n=1 Tax=Virgisporangium aliadipatigenens TaxID=741659 RepID=A0A8J3YKE7_9ACTN|nr:aminotransferase class I/II-fold pyridoxal phosphate-dependent enzyme [Virgisporangium aliadipatigenens]GIJ45922.1 GntR family transcriptional regulator [Virgisporangium aliadipatigenens]